MSGRPVTSSEQLVDRATLGLTHAPHVLRAPPAGYADQPASYGLGWNVETDHHGLLRWSHSGAFSAGASTTVVLLPQERLGVVVLTNGMPQGVPEIVADQIVDQAVAGRVTRDWRALWYGERFSHFYDGSGPQLPEQPVPPRPDAAYLGAYENAYYGSVEVSDGGWSLQLVLGPDRVTRPLTHLDGDVFTTALFPEAPRDLTAITFTVRDGEATELDIGDGDGPGTGRLIRI